MDYCASTLVLTFAALVFARVVASDGTLQVYRGKAFPSNKLPSFTNKVVANEAACAFQCASMKTNGSICTAAQYDTSSQTCWIATKCAFLKLQANASQITYVAQNYIYGDTVPKVFYPLSGSSCNLYDDWYSSTTISPAFNKSSSFTNVTTPNTYPTLTTTLWYPTATTTSWPSTPWVSITENSSSLPLDIFRGSFTIAFWYLAGCCPYAKDTPIIEFLGSSFGQMCAAVRSGCVGGCMQLFLQTTCGCSSSSFTSNSINIAKVTNWVHYTISYDSQMNLMIFYLNGTYYSAQSVNLGVKFYNISRIGVGASECNSWRDCWNSHFGSVACIQLYDTALSPTDVTKAFQLCQRSSAIFV